MLNALLLSDVGATVREPLSVPYQVIGDLLSLTEEERGHAGYQVLALQFKLQRAECVTEIL